MTLMGWLGHKTSTSQSKLFKLPSIISIFYSIYCALIRLRYTDWSGHYLSGTDAPKTHFQRIPIQISQLTFFRIPLCEWHTCYVLFCIFCEDLYKYIATDKKGIHIIFFLFLDENICCGYLAEALLMSTHNIRFRREIRKNQHFLDVKSALSVAMQIEYFFYQTYFLTVRLVF